MHSKTCKKNRPQHTIFQSSLSSFDIMTVKHHPQSDTTMRQRVVLFFSSWIIAWDYCPVNAIIRAHQRSYNDKLGNLLRAQWNKDIWLVPQLLDFWTCNCQHFWLTQEIGSLVISNRWSKHDSVLNLRFQEDPFRWYFCKLASTPRRVFQNLCWFQFQQVKSVKV